MAVNNIIATIDVSIEEIYDKLAWDEQREFLLYHIDEVDTDIVLNQFSDKDIAEYLEQNGYSVTKE